MFDARLFGIHRMRQLVQRAIGASRVRLRAARARTFADVIDCGRRIRVVGACA